MVVTVVPVLTATMAVLALAAATAMVVTVVPVLTVAMAVLALTAATAVVVTVVQALTARDLGATTINPT